MTRRSFPSRSRISDTGGEIGRGRREKARKGALSARGCRRPRAAEGFFQAGEGEVAGGEIRGILQFEPIKSMVSGWFRGRSGGGRAESMRNFESGGLQWKLRIPLTVSA